MQKGKLNQYNEVINSYGEKIEKIFLIEIGNIRYMYIFYGARKNALALYGCKYS